ncbi:hypothetical protein K1719_041560 [Acacia pycnantha]|nr:hypothetical protein K1719_041560 [Acacia pycnantha]
MEEPRISASLIWKETRAEKILIGKVLLNRSYSRAAMVSILQKAWNLQAGFEVLEINGSAFLFSFEKEEEYNRILRGRPWSINGSLLNLMERSSYKSYEEFIFSHILAWIQMHNVPLEALCLENAIKIKEYLWRSDVGEDPQYKGVFA